MNYGISVTEAIIIVIIERNWLWWHNAKDC